MICLSMSTLYKGNTETGTWCNKKDDSSKDGMCLMQLRSSGMVQWADYRQFGYSNLTLVPRKEEQGSEEDSSNEVHASFPGIQKRKNHTTEDRIVDSAKKRQACLSHQETQVKQVTSITKKKENSMPCKKGKYIDRWSIERYKLAEEKMLEVMKAEGPTFNNPISRPRLRSAARKHVGDTGLLDHLLKHIDGKLASGGTERFRRCYNTEGIMEYWLENADLVKNQRESGVPNPSWISPSRVTAGGVAFKDSVCPGEVTILKEEIVKLRSDMELLASKNQESDKANSIQELLKWRGATNIHLEKISTSFKGTQGMYSEMATWKSKIEKQLKEISNSLNSLQESKLCTTVSPTSEKWDDILESADFSSFQEIPPWLGSTDVVNIGQDSTLLENYAVSQPWLEPCGNSSHELVHARELAMLKEEMAGLKRDVQKLLTKKMEEDQANVTPESSTTESSKLDMDHSSHLFHESFKELMKWKTEIERQILEVLNVVRTLQASRN